MRKLRQGLFLMLAVMFSGAQGKSAEHVTLNSSVLLFHEWDLANCSQQVSKAQKLGNQRINFVPTLYYVTKSNLQVESYCYRGKASGCAPFTEALVAQFKSEMVQCFSKAVEFGMDISILPHLDWGGGHSIWRNYAVFDPLQKLGGKRRGEGWSYQDIMIAPILEALKETANSKTKIEFAMQGEMGATIFAHPNSYRKLLKWVKDEAKSLELKAGISLNYNKINGGVSPRKRVRTLRSLFEETDFLGISAYKSVEYPPTVKDFSATVEGMAYQLKKLGVTLPKGKEIHFSEIGLGGGTYSNDGETPAPDPQEAARCPWSGIRAGYLPSRDPWLLAANRQFRVDYHKTLMQFLKLQPGDWPVTSAYLWNSGSWDPQGLYSKGEYADSEIIRLIKIYNETGRLGL